MQTRAGKVRDAQQHQAQSTVRPATRSSQEAASKTGTSAASGGLRVQKRRRQQRASTPTDGGVKVPQQRANKRKKRNSFGSVGSSAFGGSESTIASPENPMLTPESQAKQEHKRLYGEPDVVLHVGGCSFEVHLSVIKHQSRVLYRKLASLRGQWVHHNSEHDDSVQFSSLSLGNLADDPRAVPTRLPPFSLRVVDGDKYLNTSIGSEMALSSTPAQCPLDLARNAVRPRVGEKKRRKAAAVANNDTFSAVFCVAHISSRHLVVSTASSSGASDPRASPRERLKKTKLGIDAPSPMMLRSQASKQKRGRGTFTTSMVAGTSHFTSTESPINSPTRHVEKENVGQINSQPEEAAFGLQEQEREEQKEHEHSRQQQQAAEQELADNSRAQHQDQTPGDADKQQQPVAAASATSTIKKMHVEWRYADPTAVATLLEYLYTQRIRLANEDSAEQVVQLCRWLALQNDLLCSSLRIWIERISSKKWMVALLVCSKLKNELQRQLLIDQLLEYMNNIPVERYAEILANVQMLGLEAIEDRELVGKVVMCFTNHIRHVGVWRNVLYGLERWMCWAFHRDEPPSLLEFHHQYASWDPFVTLPGVEISGEEYYVRPKTLLRFGPFSLQVRFELESLVLIQWRVIKGEVDSQGESVGLHRTDPAFVIRGDMLVRFKCFKRGPTHEEAVELHYAHSVQEYGVWKPLIMSSSASSKVLTRLEIKGVPRNGEEEVPSQSQSESVTASQSQVEPQVEEEPQEFMRALFMGRFFIWGHRLCNEHHYLSVCTQFYSSPTGSVGDLLNLDTIDKMRKLPIDTLVMILQSDRLRIPRGETTLLQILTLLCFDMNYGSSSSSSSGAVPLSAFSTTATDFSAITIVRELFKCVRWCFTDLNQIMITLERSKRKYRLYELIKSGLSDPLLKFPRRLPYNYKHNPYQVVTSLVEFEIEAGDRALSPSQSSPDDGDSDSTISN